jgi:hypothetical protein
MFKHLLLPWSAAGQYSICNPGPLLSPMDFIVSPVSAKPVSCMSQSLPAEGMPGEDVKMEDREEGAILLDTSISSLLIKLNEHSFCLLEFHPN